MKVRVSRIDPHLPLPEYATEDSAGLDLRCRENTVVEARSLGMIPTNLIVAIPEGFVLIVTLRSSTPRRTGLISPHGVGVIDRDYCGPNDEVKILVYNPTDLPVTVERGDRIAQALLMPVTRIEWNEGAPLRQDSRGGFGSTGYTTHPPVRNCNVSNDSSPTDTTI